MVSNVLWHQVMKYDTGAKEEENPGYEYCTGYAGVTTVIILGFPACFVVFSLSFFFLHFPER